jgi:hypothetical protein
MSQQTQPVPISTRLVVYQLPGAGDVTIRRDVEYRETDAGALTMDVYYPPGLRDGAQLPAVVFVSGFPDSSVQAMFGCRLKEMGGYVSWAKLAAATGLAAVTYATTDPAADIHALLRSVRRNGASLGIDPNRIGVWACSGNVPNELSALRQEPRDHLKCAVLCYGLMLDLCGSADVAEAAKAFGFVNPGAGKSVEDLPLDLPLFIVRAGQDMPQLNRTIDRFMEKALSCNLPVTFRNLPGAPHSFDLLDESDTSRETIKQMLAFMRFHLLA